MLLDLLREAAALGGGELCIAGHAWQSEGGRTCPKYAEADCSQTVYRCTRCGVYDYGEAGGPAHHECFAKCRRSFTYEIAEDAARAAEAASVTEAGFASSNDQLQGRAAAGGESLGSAS